MTGIEYEKILYSVQFEGMIIDTKITAEDNKSVNKAAIEQGSLLIYTQEEDDEAMEELNNRFFFPMPKTIRKQKDDITHICLMKIKYIGGVQLDCPLLCLFNSRSTGTLVNRCCLLSGVLINQGKERVVTTTANNIFDTSKTVHLNCIQFPEFVNG